MQLRTLAITTREYGASLLLEPISHTGFLSRNVNSLFIVFLEMDISKDLISLLQVNELAALGESRVSWVVDELVGVQQSLGTFSNQAERDGS